MNLWDKWKGLFAVLLIAVLTFSCKDEENTIGLPVENALNLKYLEYDVPVEMVWLDSTRSDEGPLFLGKFQTGESGIISASPYITFKPQAYNLSDSTALIPSNAIFDSLVLNLHYENAFDNNDESAQTYKVFRLNNPIPAFVPHYTYETLPYTELIGEKAFTYSHHSLERDRIDSLDYIETILLKPSLGHSFLTNLKMFQKFGTQNEFEQFFPGIAVEAREENSNLFTFSNTSEIVLIYSFTNNEGDLKKGKFSFTPARYFNNITPNKTSSDLSETPLTGLSCCNESLDIPGDYVYHTFGTGINLKLDLSEFKNFADTLKNPVINSAVLIIDDVTKVNPEFTIPSSIAFYITNNEGVKYKEVVAGTPVNFSLSNERTDFPNIRAGDPVVVKFDDLNDSYSAGLTLYLQNIIEEKYVPGHNLVLDLANIKETVNGLYNLEQSALLLSSIKIPKESIKIKVYYSTLK